MSETDASSPIQLYLLRHGDAEPRQPGLAEANRRLTDKGHRDVRAVMKLARAAKLEPDLILTSPLRRAKETAEIAATAFPKARVVITERLRPSAQAATVWRQVCQLCQDATVSRVLLAGHEPHISHLVRFLLGADFELEFKKGALIRIDAARAEAPRGVLLWMITPKLARAAAGKV